MSRATLDNIFDRERCQTYFDWIPVLLYFPLGLTLVTVRFFIGWYAYLVACILPKSSTIRCIVLRIIYTILGFVVIEYSSENHKGDIKIIVANHITYFDHVAINLVTNCIVPSVWDIPLYLNWILGYKEFGVKQGRMTLIQNIKDYIQGSDFPVLVFPEGASTNGKVGLLKFSSWPFSINHPVQPVVIKVFRLPPANVSPSVLGSRWWSDLFWFLFVPFTIFIIRYLPVMKQINGETSEEFSRRVQINMAKELGLETTQYTCFDKVAYAKCVLNKSPLLSPTAGKLNKHKKTGKIICDERVMIAQTTKKIVTHVLLSYNRCAVQLVLGSGKLKQ